MKNFLKGVCFFILLNFLLGININVNAASDDCVDVTICRGSMTPMNLHYKNNGIIKNAIIYQYTVKAVDPDTKFEALALCLDSNLWGPGDVGGGAASCVKYKACPSEDSGFSYIYNNGVKGNENNLNRIQAATIAARLYQPSGSAWYVADSSRLPVYNNTRAKINSDSNYLSKAIGDGILYGDNMQKAIDLYLGAKNAGDEDMESPQDLLSVEQSSSKSASNGNALVTITVNGVEDLSSGSTLRNPRILNKKTGRLYRPTNSNINLIRNPEFEVSIPADELITGEFYLKAEFFDPKDPKNVYLAEGVSGLQGMVIFNSNPRDILIPFKMETKHCYYDTRSNQYYVDGVGGKTLKQFIEAGCCDKVPDRDKGTDLYKDLCDSEKCKPTTTLGGACDKEGTELNLNESNDLLACVIGKKDYAGNAHNIMSNRYCTVGCKEDYKYTLPGAVQNVNAGYYFRLTPAEIEGSRTCGASGKENKYIEVEKFIEDLHQLNEEIVKQFNTWSENNAIVKAFPTPVDRTGWCSSDSGGSKAKGTYWHCDGYSVSYQTLAGFSYTYSKATYTRSNWSTTYTRPTGSKPSSGGMSGSSCDGGCDAIDILDINTFISARDKALEAMNTAKATRDEYISQYKYCTDWTNDYDQLFDPVLAFTYEEDLYQSMMKNNGEWDKNIQQGSTSYNYCINAATGDNYSCSGGSSSNTRTVAKSKCETSSDSCVTETITVPNNKSIKRVQVSTAIYEPNTVFITKHPSGSITTTDCTATGTCNLVDNGDGKVFPVKVTTPEGEHTFKFSFKNNGQYNDTNSTGRLDKVAAKLNAKMEYVCFYYVDEDICVDCPPEIIPSCPDCPPEIIPGGPGNPGGMTYFPRRISVNDVFPNSANDASPKTGLAQPRTVGANWTTAKGKATQLEIESAGETVYESPQYSYTITSTQMANIRAYNKAKETGSVVNIASLVNSQMASIKSFTYLKSLASGAGYSDFNLKCNSKGIDCKSLFLDDTSSRYFTDNTNRARSKTASYIHWDKVGTGMGPSWK